MIFVLFFYAHFLILIVKTVRGGNRFLFGTQSVRNKNHVNHYYFNIFLLGAAKISGLID